MRSSQDVEREGQQINGTCYRNTGDHVNIALFRGQLNIGNNHNALVTPQKCTLACPYWSLPRDSGWQAHVENK